MSALTRLAAALAVVAVLPVSTPAFDPPTDSAGPLRVTVEGPAEVARTDEPFAVRVVAENRGDRPVDATARLGLIDGWRATPAGPVPVTVQPRNTARLTFQIQPAADSHSALYPVHAFVQFTHDGAPVEAHPILIVATKLPAKTVTPTVAWQPIAVPENGRVGLAGHPVCRTIFQVFGEEPRVTPVGWQGSDDRTGTSVQTAERVTLGGQAMTTVVSHPPWRGGRAGTVAVEYPLELPRATPLRLTFATAVQPDGQGDGVTFRVRVLPGDAPAGQLGQVAFERHSAAKAWQPGAADLSAFAGQTVRLQLESHPGPKHNTGWDRCYWAEPTLAAGQPAEPLPFPPEGDAGSRLLGRLDRGERAYDVRLWPGRRGLLDAAVGFCDGPRRLYFRGFEARVPDGRLDDPAAPVVLLEAREEACPSGVQVRHRFRGVSGAFDLVGRLWVESGVLRASFRLENTPAPIPWRVVYLQGVAAGPWSVAVEQLYAGPGNVLRRPGAFRLNFDGHRLATSCVGLDFAGGWSLVQGVDVPPDELEHRPADRHCSLRAPHASLWTFIPADNVWDGARRWHDVNGLKASAGVEKLAGRFVFDLWGGRYAESAAGLRRAFRYGLTDAAVVWHSWQRWGYDYRLPEIWPPNPKVGTLAEMQDLARACREAGVLFAPHDNYIDFYPDAAGFSYRDAVVFDAAGRPQRAWLNESRGAQSYRFRPDRVAPFLRANLEKVRAGLAPDAYFIDVWSSARPFDYWTADGRFRDRVHTRAVWGGHFAWIRDYLGGHAPQISESGHDQLIGWLDGAQANHLRVGKPDPGRSGGMVWDLPCADAERTPWFDAAHHDRFVLHGAGYSDRYAAGLDPALHGIDSDDYLCTEVLTGRPSMVARPFGRDVVRRYWLLHDLGRALALKRIERVEYAGGDLHRQHVIWEGGGRVWVNRGDTDWPVEGVTLPPFGFLARVPTDAGPVEASVTRRDGVIVETSRAPELLYVNGRAVVDGPLALRPEVTGFDPAGPRGFRLALRWQADDPLPAGWAPFVHLCDAAGDIVFQAGHEPGVADRDRSGSIAATIRGTFPDNLPAGTSLEVRVGWYQPGGGERLRLSGPDDGTRRVRLGTLTLTPAGVTWRPHVAAPDPVLARQNPGRRSIDFGAVVTSGGCRLTRDGDVLVLTLLPAARPARFEARLSWAALPWRLPEPTHVERLDEDGRVLGRERVVREGGAVLVRCDEQTFCCRLVR